MISSQVTTHWLTHSPTHSLTQFYLVSTKKSVKNRAASGAVIGLTSGYDDLTGNYFSLPLDEQMDFGLTTDESDGSDNIIRRRKKMDLAIATSLDSSESDSVSSNGIDDYQRSLLFQLNLNECGLPPPDTIRLSDYVRLNAEQQDMNLDSPFSLKNNFTFSPPLMMEKSSQLSSALLNEADFTVLNGLIQSPDDKHSLVLPKVESIDTLWAHSHVQ